MPNRRQDDKGVWWHHSSHGKTYRLEERRCERCGQSFLCRPSRSTRFCQCVRQRGGEIRPCLNCGKGYYCTRGHLGKSRYCSMDCRNTSYAKGERAPNWQGGRRTAGNNGYVCVYLAPGDSFFPMANQRSKGVLEHRLVMARAIGRPLRSDEVVHHRNGIRSDNRLENLELWSKSHPAGKRIEDLLAWAHELIETYEVAVANVS